MKVKYVVLHNEGQTWTDAYGPFKTEKKAKRWAKREGLKKNKYEISVLSK